MDMKSVAGSDGTSLWTHGVPGKDSNSARKRWKASVVPVGRDPFRPGLVSQSREPRVRTHSFLILE
jgi:hypothetical protein